MSYAILIAVIVGAFAWLVAWLVREARRDRERRFEAGLRDSGRPSQSAERQNVQPRREFSARSEVDYSSQMQPLQRETLWTARSRAEPYRIEYADANGGVTERLINLQSIERVADAVYLRAFCRLRSADRTFRCDRILRAWDEVTGAELAEPGLYFAQSLLGDVRIDPEHDKVMRRVQPGLRILKWICLADQEISADELEVLLDFVEDRSKLSRAKSVAWNRARAAAEIDQMRPTLTTAASALAKMAPDGRERAVLNGAVERLLASNDEGMKRRARRLLGANYMAARATGEA